MHTPIPKSFTVNERTYAWPHAPVVVVCIDGSQPGYIEAAVTAGETPFFDRVINDGAYLSADCVIPSFTNPNNLSIVTGCPPHVHGISGNYFLDSESGEEVMMNDPKFLRAPTVFQTFQDAGGKVAVITAKDKLRRLLGHGLHFGQEGATCFSSEHADTATLAENGIENVLDLVGMNAPDVYSAALSEFVFAAGVKIMERDRPALMYLSTTDYIQHKFAPGAPEANDFYAMMDGYLERLDAMDAVIALTADHGMNAKHDHETHQPNVIYLQDLLDRAFGPNACRVILSITDPYVVHHGALGSFATIYTDASIVDEIAEHIDEIVGIDKVLSRQEACDFFELPGERIGDLTVVSEQDFVLGTRKKDHDLSGLTVPLRSHGGTSEQKVPMLLNRPVHGIEERRLRNFDAFDLALNHVSAD